MAENREQEEGDQERKQDVHAFQHVVRDRKIENARRETQTFRLYPRANPPEVVQKTGDHGQLRSDGHQELSHFGVGGTADFPRRFLLSYGSYPVHTIAHAYIARSGSPPDAAGRGWWRG